MASAGQAVNFDNGDTGIIQQWSWGENNDHFANGNSDKNKYYWYFSGLNIDVWFTGQYNLFGSPEWHIWIEYWSGSSWINIYRYANPTYVTIKNATIGWYPSLGKLYNNTNSDVISYTSKYHAWRIVYQLQSGQLSQDANGGIKFYGWAGNPNNKNTALETCYNNFLRNQDVRCTDPNVDPQMSGRSGIYRQDLTPTNSSIYNMYRTSTMKGTPIYASTLQNHFVTMSM